MKTSGFVGVYVVVGVVAMAAAGYRVSTAPERIRMRLDAAKAHCTSAGGRWIEHDRDEVCELVAAQQAH